MGKKGEGLKMEQAVIDKVEEEFEILAICNAGLCLARVQIWWRRSRSLAHFLFPRTTIPPLTDSAQSPAEPPGHGLHPPSLHPSRETSDRCTYGQVRVV